MFVSLLVLPPPIFPIKSLLLSVAAEGGGVCFGPSIRGVSRVLSNVALLLFSQFLPACNLKIMYNEWTNDTRVGIRYITYMRNARYVPDGTHLQQLSGLGCIRRTPIMHVIISLQEKSKWMLALCALSFIQGSRRWPTSCPSRSRNQSHIHQH